MVGVRPFHLILLKNSLAFVESEEAIFLLIKFRVVFNVSS